jgi:hypothetical protein
MEKQTKRKPTGAAALGAGPGRPKGVPNKTTTQLKEAILGAATDVGEDGEGKKGLVGYLTTLAKAEPKAFASLLGKVLPLQVTGEGGDAIKTDNVWRVELVRANTDAS